MAALSIDEEPLPSLAERRRRASRELMRGEILTAAQHIIRTQGMDALSLRALAKSVGVTAPALYEYFPNKDAILRALFVQGAALMLTSMDHLIADSPPGLPALLAMMQGYREFARVEPDYFQLLFGTVDPALALTPDEYTGMERIFERFIGVIASSIERGELRPAPYDILGCSLWALIHGMALLETESFLASKETGNTAKGEQFDAALRLVLLSLATPIGVELIGPIDAEHHTEGAER
jgi:AcrR family transcriptional regulator